MPLSLRLEIMKLFFISSLLLLLGHAVGAASYSYDELNRLVAVTLDSGPPQVYNYDAAGNIQSLDIGSTTTTSSTSTSSSTVSTTTTTTQTSSPGSLSYPLSLAAGWNLMGNSLNQAISVASVFGNANLVTTVWKWDTSGATTPQWQFYAPSMDAATLQIYASSKGYGVLSTINSGDGYWVNMKSASSLATQSANAYNLTAANLVTGWNLVATGNDLTPSDFNTSLNASPPSFGVTTLWAWDNALSQWYFYAPSLQATGGLANYISGKGYLDFTQYGKKLGNGIGFWVNKP
jgi:YD repeat-containing protein